MTAAGRTTERRRAARARALASALACTVAVACLAWPLPIHLATHLVDARAQGGPYARTDLDLLVWILAWDAHALATRPLEVFQANIFYPAPDALASSEHLLGLLPVAAPVFLASGNAVLTYNVTVLATVLAAALSSWALVRAWTGSEAAGLLAAAAFALSPLHVFGWTRLHATATHLFPLVLLLAARAAAAPRVRILVALALTTALQALAGIYVAYELAAFLAALAPSLWWEARRHGRRGGALAVALGVGLVAVAAIAPPYLRAQAAGTLPGYQGRLPSVGVGWLPTQLATALTWPVMALAGVGLVGARRVPLHLRLGLALVALLGALLTLGPEAPLVPGTRIPGPYALALALVPGFEGMRAPTRFAVLPLLALALLAGLGADALGRALAPRLGRRVTTGALLAGALALVVARAPLRPLPLVEEPLAGPRTAVYRWLAVHGGGEPVLELPAYTSGLDFPGLLAAGRYMLGSTLHWAPLVNGYSGHPPRSYLLLATLAERLPDSAAFAALCALADVGWIVVHESGLAPARLAAWRRGVAELPLTPAHGAGDTIVYRVRGPCGTLTAALRAQLAPPVPGEVSPTLGGVPQLPLPAGQYRGTLRGDLPAEAAAGLFTSLRVTVTNESAVAWPGLSAREGGTVVLRARWRPAAAGAATVQSEPALLARDLAPGESVSVAVGTITPPPGDHVLEVGLVQVGVGWFVDQADGAGLLAQATRTRPLGGPRNAATPP